MVTGADNADSRTASRIVSSFADVDIVIEGDVQNVAAGGLVGFARGFTIDQSHATGKVTTWNFTVDQRIPGGAGGLVGRIELPHSGDDLPNSITNSYATGEVLGPGNVGGLVGAAEGESGLHTSPIVVTNSFATGDVTSLNAQSRHVGGLIGYANYGAVDLRDPLIPASFRRDFFPSRGNRRASTRVLSAWAKRQPRIEHPPESVTIGTEIAGRASPCRTSRPS